MIVNGKSQTLSAPLLVLDYLIFEGYTPERVAVELNGVIIPRSRFVETLLSADDTLEVVSFVGGG